MALAPHLRMVVWPCTFWPHLLEKYGRTVNPTEFMQIYSTSILAAGGDEAVMANYFPVYMEDRVSMIVHDSDSISTCLFTRFDSMSIF
jgi:hypothetical protein